MPPTLFTQRERAAWGGFIAAQSRMFRLIEDQLRADHALSHPEFEVLLRLFLREDGKARIQELADQSVLSRSGTSRAVDRLIRGGFLTREGAPEDGRGAYAQLSDVGRERFLRAAEAHTELVRREFLSHFSDAELEVLAGFWRRLNVGPK